MPLLRRLAPLALVTALYSLAQTSMARAILPCLGLLCGPVGVGMLLLTALVGVFQTFPCRQPARLSPEALALLAFAVYATVGARYAGRLRVSGDEPHYLLMAQSLWREHDLDLRDNFARGDYREYVPELPAPHYAAPRADGRPFPAHSPGLPLLLAPVYALGGRLACVWLLGALAALVGREAWLLAAALTRNPASAALAWAVAAGPPMFFYAFHVYSEVPSALALAYALRVLIGGAPGLGAAAAAALATCALPWLHVKMTLAAVALGVVAVLRLERPSRDLYLAVAAAMAVGFLGYYQWVFGRPTPLAVYGGMPRELGGSSPLHTSLGLLLDRSFGLLPIAPAFLLAVPGSLRLIRFGWTRIWPLALVGAAVVMPVLPWRMWWGGQCPPARFLVPAVPLLAIAAAVPGRAGPRGLARWRGPLLAVGLALSGFALAAPERMLLLNRRDRPSRLWEALSAPGGPPVGRYLPSLVYPDAAETRVVVLWGTALLMLLALDAAAQRHDGCDRLFRGAVLPIVLGLAIGAGVDGWARRDMPAAPSRSSPDSIDKG